MEKIITNYLNRKLVGNMKKETIKNIAGVVLLYLIIIFGVILVNARIESTQKAVVETTASEIDN